MKLNMKLHKDKLHQHILLRLEPSQNGQFAFYIWSVVIASKQEYTTHKQCS